MSLMMRMLATARGPSGPTDPLWANVALLLANDGAANGSTSFLDQKTGTTWSYSGSVAYSTTNAPSGLSSSISLPGGTSSRLYTPDRASFNVGTQAFCIEAYVRRSSDAHYGTILSQFVTYPPAGNSGIWMVIGGAGDFVDYLEWTVSGSTMVYQGSATVNPTADLNAWHHVAFTYDGSTYRTFRDGVLMYSVAVSLSVFNSTGDMEVGGVAYGAGAYNSPMQLAGVRYTVGNARYTSSFTAPTLPYPSA